MGKNISSHRRSLYVHIRLAIEKNTRTSVSRKTIPSQIAEKTCQNDTYLIMILWLVFTWKVQVFNIPTSYCTTYVYSGALCTPFTSPVSLLNDKSLQQIPHQVNVQQLATSDKFQTYKFFSLVTRKNLQNLQNL